MSRKWKFVGFIDEHGNTLKTEYAIDKKTGRKAEIMRVCEDGRIELLNPQYSPMPFYRKEDEIERLPI